jgi:hypothetical protein
MGMGAERIPAAFGRRLLAGEVDIAGHLELATAE